VGGQVELVVFKQDKLTLLVVTRVPIDGSLPYGDNVPFSIGQQAGHSLPHRIFAD